LTRFRKDAATANFSVVTVNGGINNQSQPGSEVRLVFTLRVNGVVIYHHIGQYRHPIRRVDLLPDPEHLL
jgi:hypothetical protein